MVDIAKHKLYLFRILKDIYSDIELSTSLGFKGGTALMFFYDLPRFSLNLNFNLLHSEKEELVSNKIRKIVLKQGQIHDEMRKHDGFVIALSNRNVKHKLKIEISTRHWNDKYEIKNLLGVDIKVIEESYMFAHKLCALLDRSEVTNRDIFDCWFFLNRRTPVNKEIVETRMEMPLSQYLQKCIDLLEIRSDKKLLDGLGELMDAEMKNFTRTKLRSETISLLKFYKEHLIVS